MSVFRFKVFFEDDESVTREIEVKSSQSFEDLQRTIQQSIGFDNVFPALFYISNDTWRRGKPIILLRSGKKAEKGECYMHATKIASITEDPHQKFIYEYDPDNSRWILCVELLKIFSDASGDYPRIVKESGKAPPQYILNIDPDKVTDELDDKPTEIDDDDSYIHPHHFVEAAEPETTLLEVETSVETETADNLVEEDEFDGEDSAEDNFE